ncbi:MAG: EF-P lysine aminoacylase EpmA [Gammaproteobacteria bacterium]
MSKNHSLNGWAPSCSLDILRLRADVLRCIRVFFYDKGVLEVETPLLSHTTGTDPNLNFFSVIYRSPPQEKTLYLQTSPEFAMKRLLAAGCGSIYQICKSFRNGEFGRHHHPEFTLLEWYRVGFDLRQLMDETTELLTQLIRPYAKMTNPSIISYRDVFRLHAGIDPINADIPDFRRCARDHSLPEGDRLCGEDHSVWLDFLFSHLVQPCLGKNSLCMVYHYPACQSSLARNNVQNSDLTERFEVFFEGMELGNGYYELTDPVEQRRRFDAEIRERKVKGLAQPPVDEKLIGALEYGLPDCSGIAVGLDRLLMIISRHQGIENVLAFPIEST